MVFRVAKAGGKTVGGGEEEGRREEGGGQREEGRGKRAVTWQLQLRSASLRAPTPRCPASCPPPGHAPPEPPATQSPRRPPEPSQSRLRRMGALGPKPPPLLLLLILGKPGSGSQPRPAGACHLVTSPALLSSISEPLAPPSPSGAPPAFPGLAPSCCLWPRSEPVLGRAGVG